MENISEFLKTGQRKVEERENSLKRVDRASGEINDSVQAIKENSKDSILGLGVLANYLSWIRGNTDSASEKLEKIHDAVQSGKQPKVKLPNYLWLFRIAALLSLGILVLMLSRACNTSGALVSLATAQRYMLDELDGVSATELEGADETLASTKKSSNPLDRTQDSKTLVRSAEYTAVLDEVIDTDDFFHTSASVSNKWGAILEKGNQARTVAILEALSQNESLPSKVSVSLNVNGSKKNCSMS